MQSKKPLGKDVVFQRIRRITGYLTGDMRTWNDAKKAEEKDRVKHGIGGKKDGK
jgi:ribonucleoside-triphosphate reductase